MKSHTLIVGGTKGIGKTVARVFLGRGHAVTVVGRTSTSSPLHRNSGIVRYRLDVTDSGATQLGLKEICHVRGRLHNVIFLQRYRGGGDPWQGELATSLTATRDLIENALGFFDRNAPKSIVIVSSIAGNFIASEQPLSYHVAKSALLQIVRYYAVVLGPRGIRVNAVSPGTTLKSESKSFFLKNNSLLSAYRRLIPLCRMGTSLDVARAIAFFCSPDAAFVTGQNLIVDGGASLKALESLVRSQCDRRKCAKKSGR